MIVVPDVEGPRPTPVEGTLRAVCADLDARRLLTTEVFVYVLVYFAGSLVLFAQSDWRIMAPPALLAPAELVARSDADLATVKLAARKALEDYFHPLEGGDDGEGWPFGGDVHPSLVHHRLMTVDGVHRVRSLELEVDDETVPEGEEVELAAGELPTSAGHEISVTYDYGD